MEKRTPRCTLAVVKALAAAGKVRITISALAGGAATHADHRVWQDVYRPATPAGICTSNSPSWTTC